MDLRLRSEVERPLGTIVPFLKRSPVPMGKSGSGRVACLAARTAARSEWGIESEGIRQAEAERA